MTKEEREKVREKMLNTAISSRCEICGKDIRLSSMGMERKRWKKLFRTCKLPKRREKQMSKVNIESLKLIFQLAKREELDVILELTVPGSTVPEYIVVKNENLDLKLEYYLNNYDDELRLKRCSDIQIKNVIGRKIKYLED